MMQNKRILTIPNLVPVEMTYQNYKDCASEKRLLIVPGIGHGQSYWTEQENTKMRHKSFERILMDNALKKEEAVWTLKNRHCFTKQSRKL